MPTLEEVLRNGRGTERSFHCHVHDDNNASASVNVLLGVWCCYSCGAAGKVDSSKLFDKLDNFGDEIAELIAAHEEKIYPESWMDLFVNTVHPYWRTRFSAAAVEYFRLGFSSEYDQPVYPVRNLAGEILGIVRRSLNPHTTMKYRYPKGVDMHQYLFNATYQMGTKELIICEGATDVIAAWEVGVPGVAVYGDRIKYDQTVMLHQMGVRKAWVCFDQDDAGKTGAEQVLSALSMAGIEQARITWTSGKFGKDLAGMSRGERKIVLQALVPLTQR